jgi:alpha-glucosidase
MGDAVWWRDGIIHQVYPRSFQDSDGDGVGDLRGITQRLGHLVTLGVDALWLSPVQPSPMADFGYDVADYCGVDPLFGSLADFDNLVAAAHAWGLRVILDYVPNHSSDRHPWFLDSRRVRDSAKRDWYIWHDAAPDGGPPNNWRSHFGGGAWEWDAATGQYYLHSFLKQQPDLNWRNPAVRAAMYDVLRFWLDRGVDGFRVDTMWLLVKDNLFRDNPPNPAWHPGLSSHDELLPLHTADRPETSGIVAEMRSVLDGYDGRVLIGEIYLPIERLVTYYGADLRGAQLPFNFHLILAAWNAEGIARVIAEYEAALPAGAWPNWVLGNHDNSRIATRVGQAQARVAAMLLLTLRGTPTIYYGEELGMEDVVIPPDQVQDPGELNQPGLGLGRDPERTPMPWDGSALGGFTTGRPWLPLGADTVVRNVAAQAADPASMLALYRALTALRRGSRALTAGRLEAVAAECNVLRFLRLHDAERVQVLLNLGHEPCRIACEPGRVLFSTWPGRDGVAVDGTVSLSAGEGIVILAGSMPHQER